MQSYGVRGAPGAPPGDLCRISKGGDNLHLFVRESVSFARRPILYFASIAKSQDGEEREGRGKELGYSFVRLSN